uniref:Uncharacterized protein n=1 Tax=Florenciella parvula TaxID=236787 RepID=A0A7S2GDF0_9STRA|mmetsp:Transcript_9442/g.19970  ORF Transcript_9442/g.19970 Transcript_9442/m.19970 type:complete len:151 (+) Transcript_9442:2-454(+)
MPELPPIELQEGEQAPHQYDDDEASYNASEDFDFKEGRYEWEVIEKSILLPKNYIELQQKIVTAFPKHMKALAVEWPDGTTVSPAQATFMEGDCITLREYTQKGRMGRAMRSDRFPPGVGIEWDGEHENRLWSLEECWGDTERPMSKEGR